MNVKRYENNPIITKEDVAPSSEGWQVEYVMNAGCHRVGDEVLLLLRVAETPLSSDPNVFLAPYYSEKEGKICFHNLDKNDPSYDFSDSRFVLQTDENGKEILRVLTSISHLRVARSKDGRNFEIEKTPALYPSNKYEEFGIEDPRITYIEDDGYYYFNYSACASLGVTTHLARTKDWNEYERLGVIFTPDNKDVCIFPRKINGKYYAMNRPASAEYRRREIWLSESPDLVSWGNHKQLMEVNSNDWDGGRIGCSAVPFETPEGWVEIYHAADQDDRYCLGVALLDLNDPTKVIAKGKAPLMEPETDYEKYGFYGNVIFNCGVLCEDGIVKIYYGAADTCMAYAEVSLDELLKFVKA
ncbi:MAG: glycoside hydrolase family 130 protein [Planctomycetes bacterium]|nr:glycoside hydrolase family 130 protein [Planctomycetota bacterium]